ASRLRSALLVLEVALTLALLVAGVALAASYQRLWGVSPGFAPQSLVAVELVSPTSAPRTQAGYTAWALAHQRLRRQVLDHVRALPGVLGATYSMAAPFHSGDRGMFAPAGEKLFTNGVLTGVPAEHLIIGPGYFATLGVPLLRGRLFTPAEIKAAADPDSKAPQPILIDSAMARRFFPGQDPLGRQLASNLGPVVVIGVVRGTRDQDLGSTATLQAYSPDGGWPSSTFLIRTRLPLSALVPELRQAIQGTPLHMAAPVPLEQAKAKALAQPRFRTWLMGAYAALALALSLAGLYGVLAFEVQRRRREIGVRMALGADPRAVVRLVLARGLALVAAGAALGAFFAWLLMRALASLLYATPAFDPIAWLPALAALLVMLAAAGAAPALRAARLDPAASLRCE
ncbi:MAG: FtsX-like permease family protein, partial [Terriglobales bacterium]